MDSVLILAMVIIGGSGNVWGPLIGAATLIVLPEILRFVGFPSSVAANLRQIFYGAMLVICMIWRSQGLIGTYSFKSALRYK
jgi:branched-chain amino acid transport system permease protein